MMKKKKNKNCIRLEFVVHIFDQISKLVSQRRLKTIFEFKEVKEDEQLLGGYSLCCTLF